LVRFVLQFKDFITNIITLYMDWFKFYANDWLIDVKVRRLGIEDRLIYLTLLCLASSSRERGTVFSVGENDLIALANIPNDYFNDVSPCENAQGCIARFEAAGVITTRRQSDAPDIMDIVVNRFVERQNMALSNAERQKRYRKRKAPVAAVTTTVTLDKSRVEESRVDNINTYPVAKATRPVKRNKMGKYREDLSSDAFEEVIDAESGEKIAEKKASRPVAELITWAETRTGKKFPNWGKQAKMLKLIFDASYTTEQVRQCWERLETDEYWSEKGVDFGIVLSQIARKKADAPTFKSYAKKKHV